MNVKLAFADGRVGYWSNGLSPEASPSAPGLPLSFDGQQNFDMSFRNDSDAIASGYLFADAFVWTAAAALPVPEPSMAWMPGPGLLLLGWRGRGKHPAAIQALAHEAGAEDDEDGVQIGKLRSGPSPASSAAPAP